MTTREKAARYVALRKRIEALGDPEILELLDERDMLQMELEMGREVRADWAALGRRIAISDEDRACHCDACAIGYALDYALKQMSA